MKKPAFTLIELLVAASITVVVSFLAISALTSSLKIGSELQKTTVTTGQMQQALQELSGDIERATEILPIVPLNNAANYPKRDSLVAMRLYPRGVDGLPDITQPLYTAVYCSEVSGDASQLGQRRLARYTLNGSAALNSSATFNKSCTASDIAALFNGASVGAAEYLTDVSLESLNLRAWPVTATSLTAGQYYDTNPSAIRLEWTARYNPNNQGAQVKEQRANDKNIPPTILRMTVSRLTQIGVNN